MRKLKFGFMNDVILIMLRDKGEGLILYLPPPPIQSVQSFWFITFHFELVYLLIMLCRVQLYTTSQGEYL